MNLREQRTTTEIERELSKLEFIKIIILKADPSTATTGKEQRFRKNVDTESPANPRIIFLKPDS